MRLLSCELVLLLFFPFTLAALTNVTIDDTLGDPTTGSRFFFAPTNSWNVNIGGDCEGCVGSPDFSQASSHTWHVGIYVIFSPIFRFALS